jgi:lipopolysaccharide export LptBFGC system permease protein LptF
MTFDILKVLSYTVVVITVLTMIFGVIAYYFYKLRERRRKIANADSSSVPQEKEKYLYFEEKELS